MSPPVDAQARRHNRIVLLGLAALFFVPLALSFLMYYGDTWRPASMVNHGRLITPARPLPQAAVPVLAGVPPGTAWSGLKGSWSLVYLGPAGACDERCQHALITIRQTRLALNNEMTRVQRVYLLTQAPAMAGGAAGELDALERQHPGLVVVDASAPAAAPLRLAFPQDGTAISVFVVDPLGNLMMRYDTRENPRGLLLDLQKLLRLSHIG